MKTSAVLLCMLAALATQAGAAGEAGTSASISFLDYLRREEFEPLYSGELHRLALEESDESALRLYATLLMAGGHYEWASEFAESLAAGRRSADALGALIRIEGLQQRGLHDEALASIESLVPAFPAQPVLVELQYLRGKSLFNLERYEEALIHLRGIEGEVEGWVKLDVLRLLAGCEEQLGRVERATDIYEVAHLAELGWATAGLTRCHLRRGDVEKATEIYRQAVKKGIDLPHREAEELLLITEGAAPELHSAVLAALAADTTYGPAAGVQEVLMRRAERGEDVDPYCGAFLSRAAAGDAGALLRYACAASREDAHEAFDSLLAVYAEAGDLVRARCTAAMLGLAAADSSLAAREKPGISTASEVVERACSAGEKYHWLDLLARNGFTRSVPAGVADLERGLVAGFDDDSLLDLALLLARAGDREGSFSLCRNIAASPVPSRASMEAERRLYLDRLKPAGAQDMSAVIEEAASQGSSNIGLARVFDEKVGDYVKAAEYYARAAVEAGGRAQRDSLQLRLAYTHAKAYLANGPASHRDRALNMASALAASEHTAPADAMLLLKASTDWLTLDLFRATEVAGALAGREDLDREDIHELIRICYRLYERGDPQAYQVCIDLIDRFGREFASSPGGDGVLFILGRVRQLAGDHAGSLEAYEACLNETDDRVLRRLCLMGIGDCHVASGALSKGLESYEGAGEETAVAVRAARAKQVLGSKGWTASVIPGRYASLPGSMTAIVVQCIQGLYAGQLPSAAAGLRHEVVPEYGVLIHPYRQILKAHDLARAGYEGLAIHMLESLAEIPQEALRCQVLLSTYDPVGNEHTGFYLALARRLSPNCTDAMDVFAQLLMRAMLNCGGDTDEACIRAAGLFAQRFPLAQDFVNDIDAIRAASLYKEMYVGKADAIVDTLFARGVRNELLAMAVYRKGVSFLLEKANEEAKQTFLIMKGQFPDTRLYPDICFKLGTAYYLTGAYDSSAVFYRYAAGQDKISLLEDALFNLGLALEEDGDLAGASRAFLELASRFPFSDRFERALMRSAYCLEKNGFPLEARDIYKALLGYATGPETGAEANFWLGECMAKAGRHVEAALEFMRTGFFYGGEEAWAGTARYRAGMECESAGLKRAAKLIYEENVRDFGRDSTWGKASFERLVEVNSEG